MGDTENTGWANSGQAGPGPRRPEAMGRTAKKGWWASLSESARTALVVTGAVALAVILVASVLVAVVGQLLGGGSGVVSKAFDGPGHSYIAKIKVVGSIGSSASQYYSSDSVYHHAWTLETIDTLIKDGNNTGIYLWLNTPGGTVYESDELYLKLMEYKEKTGRPIFAYMGNMAASGGYYVASAADGIYANRNTWTGSIGVTIGTFIDVSGFLEEHGIHTETITAGRNKAMGGYYDPLTEEQKQIYQGLVDEAYDQFVSIVAEGRGKTKQDVEALADGRIYTAAQALEAGLIDVIATEKEADEAVKASLGDGSSIVDCYYRPDAYFSLLGSLAGGDFSLLGLLRDALRDLPGGEAAGRPGAVYEGDVAAVLDLVRGSDEAGAPPLQYLYTG